MDLLDTLSPRRASSISISLTCCMASRRRLMSSTAAIASGRWCALSNRNRDRNRNTAVQNMDRKSTESVEGGEDGQL